MKYLFNSRKSYKDYKNTIVSFEFNLFVLILLLTKTMSTL